METKIHCNSSVQWRNRSAVAALLVPLLVLILSNKWATCAFIVVVVCLATIEYAELFSCFFLIKYDSEKAPQRRGIARKDLCCVAPIFILACASDPSQYAGTLFLAFSYVFVLFVSIAALVPFLDAVGGGRKHLSVDMLISKIGLDLYFFFHFIWGLAFAIYARKLPKGIGIGLVLLSCNFLGDTGALILGSKFGRTSVMSLISPKKSYAGILGSFVFSIAAASTLFLFSDIFPTVLIADEVNFRDYLILGIAIAGVGVCGDFLESALKRITGVKDSSNLLGSHGGILDRLDSLCIAAPVTYLFCAHLINTP